MKRLIAISAALIALAVVPYGSKPDGIRVGSKQFSEGIILGEILAQAIRADGSPVTHMAQLGGTRIVFDALQRGEIDLYPEYTGTLRQEIFASQAPATDRELADLLQAEGISMGRSLGFNNSYALAVRQETARRLRLATIEDLASHPELRLGFSNEFLDREDGWKNLRIRYGLPHENVIGLEHDLAYRRLEADTLDVIDVYTTDARLAKLNLVVLEDSQNYFPRYDAVVLYRSELSNEHPQVVAQLAELEGQLTLSEIKRLNLLVDSREVSEARAAGAFLRERLGIEVDVEDLSTAQRIWRRTLEHCDLVRRSLIPAIFAAIPLGVLAAKLPRLGQVILAVVGIVQTIPALALLVLLIPLAAYFELDTLGAGSATAVAALFLYSLLPIVRNTATGVASIAPEYQESAEALGLSPAFRLLNIELPLASPSILAGVKTAAILNVGFATLGALVGARGYGQPILTGIRLNSTSLILQGAVPAACLAIALQAFFEFGERWFLPAGLRTKSKGLDHDGA